MTEPLHTTCKLETLHPSHGQLADGTCAIDGLVKINATLTVGQARPDGMHPVETWMLALPVGDRIQVHWLGDRVPTPPTAPTDSQQTNDAIQGAHSQARLHRSVADDALGPITVDWPASSDLAARAWQAFETHSGQALPVAIHIDKRVPPGTGLGAGSCDAAAVLWACQMLCKQQLGNALPMDQLFAIASQLGSDVPFFVAALAGVHSAIGTNTGGDLTMAPWQPAPSQTPHAVLLLSDIACPTGAIYQAFDANQPPAAHGPSASMLRETTDTHRWTQLLWNDLTDPAMQVKPELKALQIEARNAIQQPVHLSGSGSALFVLTGNKQAAEQVCRVLNASKTASILRTFLVPLLPALVR